MQLQFGSYHLASLQSICLIVEKLVWDREACVVGTVMQVYWAFHIKIATLY
jgi:hypothetical protein